MAVLCTWDLQTLRLMVNAAVFVRVQSVVLLGIAFVWTKVIQLQEEGPVLELVAFLFSKV